MGGTGARWVMGNDEHKRRKEKEIEEVMETEKGRSDGREEGGGNGDGRRVFKVVMGRSRRRAGHDGHEDERKEGEEEEEDNADDNNKEEKERRCELGGKERGSGIWDFRGARDGRKKRKQPNNLREERHVQVP